MDVFDFKEEDDELQFSPPTKLKNPNNGLGVFDFKDEDELQFPTSSKLKYPKHVDNGNYSIEKMASFNGDLLLNYSSRVHQQHLPNEVSPDSMCTRFDRKVLRTEAASQMDDPLPDSNSRDEADEVFADAYDSPGESSASTSSYVSGDDVGLEGNISLPDSCFDFVQQLGDRNAALVCPEYIVYQGRYSTESVLIFSKEGMKLKDSATHGDQGISRFEWDICDIVDIQSQWSKRLEVAMVKLRMLLKGAGDVSVVEEIQFAVADVNWPAKQEEIMSLDVRYRGAWNVLVDTESEIPGTSAESIFRKSYFPNFVEFTEELIYPKGDPDPVSISKRDIGLLQPDIFVNDTIIDFYIKYLKNQMPLENRNRFHFFNSFFFRKLIDLDKESSSSFEGKAAFQRVRKWTRKVNLFEKDYIFIPVNYSYHWSLIVICHPGEVSNSRDEEMENSLKVPCILHMDSLKGGHTVLKDIIQSYLCEEWKEKNKDTADDISPKFLNMRFISLELPQQPNAYDCGLFLLHYVELFLEEAPINFSPYKMTKSNNFLNLDWFRPEEPCLKRAYIQRLFCKILKGENPEHSAATWDSNPCALNNPANTNASESNLDLNSKRCSPSKSVPGALSGSQSSEGIEITLLQTSSSQHGCAADPILREFMGVGTTGNTFLDGLYESFDQAAFGALGRMQQDDAEACDGLVFTQSNMNPDYVVPYSSNGLEADVHNGNHNDFGEHKENSGGSGYSSEVEIQENKPLGNTVLIEERANVPKSPYAEKPISDPNQTLDVGDFQCCDDNLNSHEDVQEIGEVTCYEADIDCVRESLVSAMDEKQGSETVSEILVSGTDGMLDLKRVGKAEVSNTVSETDGMPDLKMIGKAEVSDTVSETDGMPDLETIVKIEGSDTVSEVMVPETDAMLELNNDLVSESDGQCVAKRITDALIQELDELQPAKRPRLSPSPDGEKVNDL